MSAKKLTFEQQIQRLEEIVAALEKGDAQLADSLARLEARLSSRCRAASSRPVSHWTILSPAPRSHRSNSIWSGTAISAALEGVDALASATKSEMVTSGSWPTAEMMGVSQS